MEQACAEGIDLIGPDGLLAGLTKTVFETALEAEMTARPRRRQRRQRMTSGFRRVPGDFNVTFARPSIPVETYLWLMLLTVRYRLGYQ